MKYFLKVLINNKIHYFVPNVIASGVTIDEDYIIFASVKDDKYSFQIIKDRKYIDGFNHDIKPRQKIEIVDNGNTLIFSLTYSKRRVKKYLKSKPGTTVREMDEFYEYIGKERKNKKRPYAPWNPTSGMDPDLRDEYARKGNK